MEPQRTQRNAEEGRGKAKMEPQRTQRNAEATRMKNGKPEVQREKLNWISGQVVDAAMRVHTALGPGLLESAYEACLLFELHKRGIQATRQVELPVVYQGVKIDVGYRLDLLVEESVIVELKAVEEVLPIHTAQLMSYLKLSDRRLGLLLNFNVVHMQEGITRVVNRF